MTAVARGVARIPGARPRIASRPRALAAGIRVVGLLLLLVLTGAVHAQTRAWLDRDRIAMGETTTLNVETDVGASPDFAPLLGDFDLGGQASQQQLQWVNGRASARALYAVALRPRHDGLLRIPALRVGGATTAPLTLLVTPASAAPAPASNADVFIESEADTQAPYVQQSVGWVVRLYSAIPLIAGRLDQPEPDGAGLQRVGDDVQYRRTVNGRDYMVTERRFLLIPERSGELVVPPARFDGRGSGNAFDRLFGDGEDALHAVARPRVLRVLPIPAGAPQPWLPLRALTLRYVERPTQARVGSAATVVVALDADGAGAAQVPALELPASDGAQVFAERAQSDESMADGRPQVRVQRRFQVVPTREGRLVLRGPRIAWWDSRAGVARETVLPPIELQVAPGDPARGASASTPDAGAAMRTAPGGRPSAGLLGALAAGALALVVLGFGMRGRRAARAAAAAAVGRATTPPPVPGETGEASTIGPQAADAVSKPSATSASPSPIPSAPRTAAPRTPLSATAVAPSLAEGLAGGDLAVVEAALRRLAGGADLDTVVGRLADPAQRDAVDRLRRARWAGGDAADALSRLRAAFATGPAWRAAPRTRGDDGLPPLYPDP